MCSFDQRGVAIGCGVQKQRQAISLSSARRSPHSLVNQIQSQKTHSLPFLPLMDTVSKIDLLVITSSMGLVAHGGAKESHRRSISKNLRRTTRCKNLSSPMGL